MNDETALHEAQRLARGGRVTYTRHAFDRMEERGATPGDVIEAVLSATRARYQTDRENWKLTGGTDAVGDPLAVVVDFIGNLLVITIF